jgi:hypothetical protein
MKLKALLTALFGILLAGCSLRGHPAKSAAPPAAPKPAVSPGLTPPPPPLSVPQTRVELPKPQPIDPAALATEAAPPEPEAPPAAVPPSRPRRVNPPTGQPVSQPVSPPAAVTPPLETREPVEEIITPAEIKRLLESAQARRREANQILDQFARRMNATQQKLADTIRSFLTLSEEAEKRNDPRQADALAERAQILAKELQSGR